MNTKITTADCVLNISLKERAFLWTQQKTSSTLALEIFKNFGFIGYSINNNVADFSNPFFFHPHEPCLFDGHENFILIATIRNPYTLLFSEFAQAKDPTTEKFHNFLEKKFQVFKKDKFFSKWKREPNYLIRVENLLEDYSKIPFIKESEFFKSGKLENEINKNHNKNPKAYYWRNFFNQDVADLIYYNTSNYFEKFGYDKNSWK